MARVVQETDGRRARRERGRAAVIEAMVDLVQEGHTPPTAEMVAERAGVSVSSLFRYFDGLDELQEQTAERFVERYAALFELPEVGVGELPDRIDRLVRSRVELYETIAPMAMLARARSLDHPHLAARVSAVRIRMAEQVGGHFHAELRAVAKSARDDLVSVITVMTSFESYQMLRQDHGRSTAQVRRAWSSALTALLAAA